MSKDSKRDQLRQQIAAKVGQTWRKARGERTQEEVAQLLGCRANFVSRVELGRALPDTLFFLRAIVVLKIPPNELLFEELGEEELPSQAPRTPSYVRKVVEARARHDRLSCGHTLAATQVRNPKRRCWKCEKGISTAAEELPSEVTT